MNKPRLAVVLVGVCSAALLSAGLVGAQTATQPRPDAAGGQTPPEAGSPAPPAELPPQEAAPQAAPAPNVGAPTARPDAASQDGVEAKDESDGETADNAQPAAPDPAKRETHSAAVVQALDKITAETMRFEVRAGQPVCWKGLVFSLRTCETTAPNEPVKDSIAYLQVRSEPRAQSEEASREIFHGWMFASSPGLNPLKHPVYDAWLIACRT
jgi:hypothetical protein